jgi:hypothetical protein
VGYTSRNFGGAYYCPKHLGMLMDGFDPQVGDRVRPISGPSWREYIVVGRDGDNVSVKILGRPEVEPVCIRVGNLYPGSFDHVYGNSRVKGCGQKLSPK